MTQAITVLGRGAFGALGMALRPLAFAMRARQLELRDTPFSDAMGVRIPASFAPSIDVSVHGEQRIAVLLARAIADAQRSRSGRAGGEAVLLVVAPPPSTVDAGADHRLLQRLSELLRRPPVTGSRVIRAGHAGSALALREARTLLREGAREVLVAAAATPIDGPALAAFDARGTLFSDQRRGRIPGEAAAALRLGLRRPSATSARVAEVEHEPAAGDDRGAGGRMLRRARGALASGSLDLVIVDLNGDAARSDAWDADFDAARSALIDVDIEAWPDLTGDLGAASGVLFAAVAVELAATAASPLANVAVVLRGDDGAIGAFALELPSPSGDFTASSDAPRPRELPPGRLPTSPAERAHAARMARSLFEDLAAMGLLLAPGPAGPDRQAAARRLLDAYDALCTLAVPGPGRSPQLDILAALDAWASEVDPPDRGRRFASAFLRAHLSR